MSNFGLQTTFEESVSAVTATNSVAIGTERWENGRKYIYAYNKSTSTAGVGYGVVYSAASGYSVTVSSIAGENLAGVVINADIGPTEYGWIVVKGHVPVQSSGNSAIAQGNKLILDTVGAFTRTTGATGYTGIVAGVATGSTATAGTFAAFINVG